MFLYPALTIGFLFVGVPLLVHLINMLRHRRQRWAAMDFLLASYRKQKKWIVLRQLLLLLARLAVAALLIALLSGWTGGRQLLGALGGQATHHVVILDDSYSMGDISGGSTAYSRALGALQDLTRRLASDEGNHQLTIMRASRAAMAIRGGSDAGDAAADLSAQTITADGRLINRVMGTDVSPIRTDLVPAIDLASEFVEATPADATFLYIASDFRQQDWSSPERLAESLQKTSAAGATVRMIDCANEPLPNLAVTSLTPAPDVWVAGVPVVVNATIRNYGDSTASNVALSCRVATYGAGVEIADPSQQLSGTSESLPTIIIESLEPGAVTTRSFQVYVTETGTHAVEVALPEDALPIDNRRVCTLPLTDTERVLIIDGDPDARGAYHIASVLDPGSQVRIGAIPDVQPPSFLRSVTLEKLAAYRAVYLINLPEVSETAADALSRYVQRGGGLAWFLGDEVNPEAYNATLHGGERQLLPAPLGPVAELVPSPEATTGDLVMGEDTSLLAPLKSGGDAAFTLVGLSKSWTLDKQPPEGDGLPVQRAEVAEDEGIDSETADAVPENASPPAETPAPRIREPLKRSDGLPLVTQHEVGRGRVITVLTGLDGRWTNWPGDPTFVVFLLQANATLWSGAAPPTSRFVDDALVKLLPPDEFAEMATFLPAANEPPRVPIELAAGATSLGGRGAVSENERASTDGSAAADQARSEPGNVPVIVLDPNQMIIEDVQNVEEIIRPGIAEWMLTRVSGRTDVTPVASVIRVGEGDLTRANQSEIARELMPVEVEFVSSSVWSEENQTAGSSIISLALLGLLAGFLAIEQLLGYWAGYHVSPIIGGKR